MGVQLYESGMLIPLEERDRELEELWKALEDVPMNPETEEIEEQFLHFAAGTHREHIWKWFDERYSKGVYHLLYGNGVDRTSETAKMLYLKGKCFDCDAEHCVFNPDGVCKFPFLSGRDPVLDDDGCHDFCYKDEDNTPLFPVVKKGEDALLKFIEQEVPFRLREVLMIDEDQISDDMVEECVEALHDNSDIMFNYDSIDEKLMDVCRGYGIEDFGE